MDDLAIFLGVLAPVSLIAGFIRGFTGLGGPLILVPTLSLFIPPPAAAWVVNWVDVIANIKLLPDTRAHVSRSIVLPLMVGSVFTIPLGVYLLVSIDATIMRRTICAAILVAALILTAGWRYRGPTGTLVWVAVGAFSGFILGATSIALTAALFLHAGQQRAAESRANFIVWVFFGACTFLLLMGYHRGMAEPRFYEIAILAPLYFAGTSLGARYHARADEHLVRRLVIGLIIIVATVGLLR